MSFYGEASERLIEWIVSDTQRVKDFATISGEHNTVSAYLAHYAYRPDIIRETIHTLVSIAEDRLTKQILSL